MSAPSRKFGTRCKFILIPLQVVLFALVTAAMAGPIVEMHRRQQRSWPAIVVRMSPECRLAWTTPDPERQKLVIARWTGSPRTAFQDAGVLMEIAEFAERNAVDFDPARLQDFRSAALELRFAAARAMLRGTLFR